MCRKIEPVECAGHSVWTTTELRDVGLPCTYPFHLALQANLGHTIDSRYVESSGYSMGVRGLDLDLCNLQSTVYTLWSHESTRSRWRRASTHARLEALQQSDGDGAGLRARQRWH